jgi:nitrite reductase/ring-hydroxylating ferredoxin subunit/uncharacterized membrane protein
MTAPRTAPLPAVLDRVERAEMLDRVIAPVEKAVRRVPEGTRRMLHGGGWLEHPLHPALVHLPLGAWMAAGVMDAVRRPSAAQWLTGLGLVSAVPAAAAGLADWADLHKQQKRVGLVHAAANSLGVVLYAGSLATRCVGTGRLGRRLGLAGLIAVSAGGAIGGHLAYRQAAGANHAEAVPHLVPPGWHPLGRLEEYPAGRSMRASLGHVPLLVRREHDGTVHVLANQCSHLSGPLAAGDVVDGCVVCPWHASAFRLTDGRAVAGPATAPQPVFETRVAEGRLEVRLPVAG